MCTCCTRFFQQVISLSLSSIHASTPFQPLCFAIQLKCLYCFVHCMAKFHIETESKKAKKPAPTAANVVEVKKRIHTVERLCIELYNIHRNLWIAHSHLKLYCHWGHLCEIIPTECAVIYMRCIYSISQSLGQCSGMICCALLGLAW